jgi:hypothetical protein
VPADRSRAPLVATVAVLVVGAAAAITWVVLDLRARDARLAEPLPPSPPPAPEPATPEPANVDAVPHPAPTSGIAPEPYRAEIEALERTLWGAEVAYGFDTGFARLGERLVERGERDLGLEALSLGAGLNAGDVGYAAPEVGPARMRWLAFRERVFGPAPWYRSADAPIEAPPAGPPALDDATRAQLLHAAAALDRLVALGRARALRIPEVQGEADRSAEREWSTFLSGWDAEVRRVRVPAQDSVAGAALAQAWHELTLLGTTGYDWTSVPAVWERTARLDAAAQHLAEARAALAP